MTDDELLKGENHNVEYKRELPEKSIKYVKSVVAFANGSGGRIVFGVDDETREVVGMDTENIFKTIDAITTAIADSCEPAIMPNVALKTIDGNIDMEVGVRVNFYRPTEEIRQATDKVTVQVNTQDNQDNTQVSDKVIGEISDKVAGFTDKAADKVSDKALNRHKALIISINNDSLERKEIIQRMELNHISFFIDTYLNPAIQQGYVAMLYPDKPRHPKQKYYLTEKGKELLKTLQSQT